MLGAMTVIQIERAATTPVPAARAELAGHVGADGVGRRIELAPPVVDELRHAPSPVS
jgi:hypothetical protein